MIDLIIKKAFLLQNELDKTVDGFPYLAQHPKARLHTYGDETHELYFNYLLDKKTKMPLAFVNASSAPNYSHNFIIIFESYREKFEPLVKYLNGQKINDTSISFSVSYASIPGENNKF